MLRLADVRREMDSLLVIRVESTGIITGTSNSKVTGAALSIITNEKDEAYAVNCLESRVILPSR